MNIINLFRNLNSFLNTRRLLIFLISAITILFIAILVFSDGFNGNDDTLLHFNYSQWAYSNPNLLIDMKTAPLFTLLSAPFALLGIKTLLLFNILLGISSAYISYLIANELKMKSPILAIVICCFTPIYMSNMFSGNTEILFGFVTILTSYLFIKKRYKAGAIVLSLLPLIRIEGYIFLLTYAIFLLNKKHFKEIALMLTGFVLYSIIGVCAGKNFFWLITELSYGYNNEAFGTGGIFQYIKRSPGYFGIANEIFFVTGLVAGITRYLRKKKEYSQELLLVVLPFLTYIIIHAIAWRFGIFSKGLTRYMVAVVPLMAVMATRGLVIFSLMFEIIFKSETIRKLALCFAFISIIIIPFYTQAYPVKISNINNTAKEASTWIKNNTFSRTKIHYTSQMFGFFHELNPLITSTNQNYLNNNEFLENEIEIDELLVVDTYNAKVQGINFDNLINSPYFELLKIIEPVFPEKPLNTNYLVGIFKRTERTDENIINNNLIYNGLSQGFVTLISHDFNTPSIDEALLMNIETERNSQNKYLRINRQNKINLRDTIRFSTAQAPIVLQIEAKQSKETPDEDLRFVVETHYKGKQLDKKIFAFSLPQQPLKNQWHKILLRVQLPEVTDPQNTTVITYLWNKRKKGFLLDDYSISLKTNDETTR